MCSALLCLVDRGFLLRARVILKQLWAVLLVASMKLGSAVLAVLTTFSVWPMGFPVEGVEELSDCNFGLRFRVRQLKILVITALETQHLKYSRPNPTS